MFVEFDPAHETVSGPCPCCGEMTRVVWGSVIQDEATVAVYYVQWTPGKLQHKPNFDLILGPWGEDALDEERFAVSLSYWPEKGSFMVIDAGERPVSKSSLIGRALRRDEVIGTEIADYAFDVVDAVFLQDKRLAEMSSAK